MYFTQSTAQTHNTRAGPHQEKNEEEVVETCTRPTQRVGNDAHTRVEGQHLRRCSEEGDWLRLSKARVKCVRYMKIRDTTSWQNKANEQHLGLGGKKRRTRRRRAQRTKLPKKKDASTILASVVLDDTVQKQVGEHIPNPPTHKTHQASSFSRSEDSLIEADQTSPFQLPCLLCGFVDDLSLTTYLKRHPLGSYWESRTHRTKETNDKTNRENTKQSQSDNTPRGHIKKGGRKNITVPGISSGTVPPGW